jgi:hypothetical protein
VTEFLELLPDQTRWILYLSAIPNAIHSNLLQDLAGDEPVDGDFLERLHENYLLNKGEGGWYYYTSEVRQALHDFWRQPRQLHAYRSANRIAFSYFDELAAQTKSPGNYIYAREALYHLLLEGEASGLERMAELFETACDQREVGAAQTFSIQLRKTLPELSALAAQYASYYQ